jgi:hypothetical protein
MSVRGRGTLEVRKCDNPFFQTTNADIGLSASNTNFEWTTDNSQNGGNSTLASSIKPYKVDGNFAFLYTRESDLIGAKVKKPEVSEVRMLSRSEFLKKRREKALSDAEAAGELQYDDTPAYKPTPEDFLRAYHHLPKEEDPRYLTSGVNYLIVILCLLFSNSFCLVYRMITERNLLLLLRSSQREPLGRRDFLSRFKILSRRTLV